MTPDVPAESLDAESLDEDFAPPLSRMLLVVVALLVEWFCRVPPVDSDEQGRGGVTA